MMVNGFDLVGYRSIFLIVFKDYNSGKLINPTFGGYFYGGSEEFRYRDLSNTVQWNYVINKLDEDYKILYVCTKLIESMYEQT